MANTNSTCAIRFVSAICLPIIMAFPGRFLGDESKKSLDISPEPQIQEMIRRIIYAPDEENKEGADASRMLMRMAVRTPELVAPQLIYYGSRVSNDREAEGMIGMLGRFAWISRLRFSILPFLESEQKKVRDEARLWLLSIDGGEAAAPSNVRHYYETLLRQKEAPPRGLVDYVYTVSPSQALLMYGNIYSEKPKFGDWPRSLMWSDHLIGTMKWRFVNQFLQEGYLEKARKELDRLSRHQDWYARRYVVEILRDNPNAIFGDGFGVPQLGSPEIAERLKSDKNPLVRDPAQQIKSAGR